MASGKGPHLKEVGTLSGGEEVLPHGNKREGKVF